MDLETRVTKTVELMAERAISADDKARADLAANLAGGRLLGASAIREVLEAQALAGKWRKVTDRMAQRGLSAADAVRSVREELIQQLLEVGESQSTAAIVNEVERVEREAGRRFLSATSFLV